MTRLHLHQPGLFEDQGDRHPEQLSLLSPDDAQFEPIARDRVQTATGRPVRERQAELFPPKTVAEVTLT